MAPSWRLRACAAAVAGVRHKRSGDRPRLAAPHALYCRALQQKLVELAEAFAAWCAEQGQRPDSAEARASLNRSTVNETAIAAVWAQPVQSTAISRASQISRIRVSESRPRRLTKTATDTLSTESRLTAERRGIGSDPGSRTASLASPRIVVVHGATRARRKRGIAASRDRTTTGRQPISASSHHHTSPRAGHAFTNGRPPVATMPNRPTRRAPQARSTPTFRRTDVLCNVNASLDRRDERVLDAAQPYLVGPAGLPRRGFATQNGQVVGNTAQQPKDSSLIDHGAPLRQTPCGRE